MARIIPEAWQALRKAPLAPPVARKLDTLERLAQELPAGYSVYHDVQWNQTGSGTARFGSVDFAVVSPAGQLLLIEQQSGFLSEAAGSLTRSGRSVTQVSHRLGQSAATVRSGLGGGAQVDVLLYLPDYSVQDRASAGVDAARIIDAPRRESLCATILSILPADAPVQTDVAAVHRYLADALRLVPDVGAVAGAAETLYARLSGGLNEWARRIEMSPHRLRISATAGSGKTQLAVSVYRDALAAGRRPLFVCFNRPLADHFASLVPAGGEVASYYQLCNRIVRSTGLVPDFRQADAFERIERAFATMAVPADWVFDELIVDEGQDFSSAWRDALLRLLKPGGRAWWLEDPLQNLYGREPVPLAGWVGLRSGTNYRSPREVVDFLNRLMPGQDVLAGSPLAGGAITLESYDSRDTLIDRSRRAVTAAIGLGFRRDQIVLLSFHGRERSVFSGMERLGPIPLRHFSGQYDAHGVPQFSAGDVLCETVYRFKGQSAPCVILTEIDAAVLDELALRKIFVGATRATLNLSLVASAPAAAALAACL